MEKNVPKVLSTAQGHRPRAETKTEGTIFPDTDWPRPVNNIFISFPQENKAQVSQQIQQILRAG